MTVRSAADQLVIAPEELSLDSRTEFRGRANMAIDSIRPGCGRLIVDMERTRSMDSAGLGTLILVQRRAAGRRVRVGLRNVNDDLRFLLAFTKVEDLFDIESP